MVAAVFLIECTTKDLWLFLLIYNDFIQRLGLERKPINSVLSPSRPLAQVLESQ